MMSRFGHWILALAVPHGIVEAQQLYSDAIVYWGDGGGPGGCNFGWGCTDIGTNSAYTDGTCTQTSASARQPPFYGITTINALASCAPGNLNCLLNIAGVVNGSTNHRAQVDPWAEAEAKWTEYWIVTGATGSGSVTFQYALTQLPVQPRAIVNPTVEVGTPGGPLTSLPAPYSLQVPITFGGQFGRVSRLIYRLTWDQDPGSNCNSNLVSPAVALTAHAGLSLVSVTVRDASGAIVPNAKIGTSSRTHIPGVTTPLPSRFYVDASATGLNDGTSWADAFRSLRDALQVARAWPGGGPNGVSEIWVAAGTYRPNDSFGAPLTGTGPTFDLMNGIQVYGGFAGTETALSQRNISANPTILTGALGGTWSRHVLTASGTNATAVLDGFVVRDGYASGNESSYHQWGGGILIVNAIPTLRNVRFTNNRAYGNGGAIAVINGGCPTLLDCVLDNNRTLSIQWSSGMGGAVGLIGGSIILERCVLRNNTASNSGGALYTDGTGGPSLLRNVWCEANTSTGGAGGGFYDAGSFPSTLEGCVFLNNSSLSNGGGAYFGQGGTTTNCTFVNNSPRALHCQGVGATVDNSILWHTTSTTTQLSGSVATQVRNSIVKGGWAGGVNVLNSDPLLDPVTLIPTGASPAIDRGDDAAVPTALALDIAGLPRIIDHCASSGPANGLVDLGAHEVPCANAAVILYGSGHPGTLGVPSITAAPIPVVGATTTIAIGNSLGAPTLGILAFGPARPASPLPLMGGQLLVDPQALISLLLQFASPADVFVPLPIPGGGWLCGQSFYCQALELDSGASQGVAFTAGLQLRIGL